MCMCVYLTFSLLQCSLVTRLKARASCTCLVFVYYHGPEAEGVVIIKDTIYLVDIYSVNDKVG